MAWGGEINNSDEPLWCLVDKGGDKTSLILMAETKEAREKRHLGESKPDGKEVVAELDEKLSRFINRNRRDCRHEDLLNLVELVSSEVIKQNTKKIGSRLTTSSVL